MAQFTCTTTTIPPSPPSPHRLSRHSLASKTDDHASKTDDDIKADDMAATRISIGGVFSGVMPPSTSAITVPCVAQLVRAGPVTQTSDAANFPALPIASLHASDMGCDRVNCGGVMTTRGREHRNLPKRK
eukprot:m.129141 g.129141  ORF g.129141 m.129141 type:complete len:130 (-) comp13885_c0_seq3:258-647(-)